MDDISIIVANGDTPATDAAPPEIIIPSASVGLSINVVPSAALPAPGPLQDGRILIEDAGSAHNLIVYAGGFRTRLTGVSF